MGRVRQTASPLKTAIYAQCLLELAGVNPVPRYTADHNDIVTCFDSGSAAALKGFCAGIQHNSPVDSFASPEPADEPGYTDKVVIDVYKRQVLNADDDAAGHRAAAVWQ